MSVIEHVHPDPYYVNAVREFYERRPDERISFLEVRNKCGITHGQCDEAHRLLKRRGEIVAVSFSGGSQGGTYRLTTPEERGGRADVPEVKPEITEPNVVPIRGEYLQRAIEDERALGEAAINDAHEVQKRGGGEPPKQKTYRPCNDDEVYEAIRLLTASGKVATSATIGELTGFDPNSVGACLSEAMHKNLLLHRKKIPNPITGGRGKAFHYWFEQPPTAEQPEPQPAAQPPKEEPKAAATVAQPSVSHDLPKYVTLSLYARIVEAAGNKLNKFDYQAIRIAFGLSEDDVK